MYTGSNRPKALKFNKLKVVVIGCSKARITSHYGFREKNKLSIILVSDENHEIMEKYGVWRPKKFMGREFLGTVRSTFLIDPKGRIAYMGSSKRTCRRSTS